MCGIAGFFLRAPLDARSLATSFDELRRRGPDSQHAVLWGAGYRDRLTSGSGTAQRASEPSADVFGGLLHARLAIIDPRPVGDQPMCNDSGDIWICYNGEVYDWAADARLLQSRGVVMRTRTDTEFILRAYETWGIDCLSRLRGMFAFVIVDLRQRKLWAVRDRMGEKPLLYSFGQHGFAFGSTLRALLPLLPANTRRLRAQAIDAYLAHRYVPAPMTVMQSVQRLENAHLLCYDLDRHTLEKRCWWVAGASDGDWLAELDNAVRMRTVADRPVGLFLSGGIDSSVIASRLALDGHKQLTSFTAAFPGTVFDESQQAGEVAAALGFANRQLALEADAANDFATIVRDFDEPFADPSAFPTWQLARRTTQEVKVVLSGDGGDELFAGYKRYDKHLRTRWRRGLRLPMLPLRPGHASGGHAKWLTEMHMSWLDAYSLRFSGFTPGQRMALQGGRPLERLVWWRRTDTRPGTKAGDNDGLEVGDHEASPADPLGQLLGVDLANYLPEYILRKSDLATMAHGLELRAPMLDHRWVETIIGLPASRRFTRPPKMLLAQALTLPPTLDLFAGKKRGFTPPVTAMLQGGLAPRLAGTAQRLADSTNGQLEAAAVQGFIDRFERGATALAEQVLQLLILDESLTQLRAA